MPRFSWFHGGVTRKSTNSKKRAKCNDSLSVYEYNSDTDDLYFIGAGLDSIDPDEERNPPPPPTQVTFPAYERCTQIDWSHPAALPEFQSLFARIQRPKDVSKCHLEALNIEICLPCAPDQLLPLATDGTSYLPPMTPCQALTPASYADATRADTIVSEKRKAFGDRVAEVQVNNDTAYRTLSRKLKDGARGPKLATMRKFWEGLESMSRYWDCSLDQYYELPSHDENGGKSVKRQRLDPGPPSPSAERASESQDCSAITDTKPRSPNHTFQATLAEGPDELHGKANGEDNAESCNLGVPSQTVTPPPEPTPKWRYRGLRTHAGTDMPDQFRVDTVRGFVEGAVWAFKCNVTPPRVLPLVEFGKLRLPVRQTAAVYRMPTERARARQGWLEGPVIAMQVRNEADFANASGQSLEVKSRLDVMRELGGLLQLAQERRRECRAETKPGEGMWWTMRPRWGGGPGGKVEQESGNSDVVQATEEILDGLKAQKGSIERVSSKTRGRKTPVQLWRELKCGSGFWDPKTQYMAIGKEPDKGYDEVFMVSCLNHHVSILKLTVHDAYTDYLISGRMPEPLPEDGAWCRPKLQRTKWFDLFDQGERVEAFRALWGVLAYLTRAPGVVAASNDTEMSGTA